MYSIIFVGGFGASFDYSKTMCQELQRIIQYKVYNMNLHHGFTLEEECQHILSGITHKSSKYIIIGFSTGCLIAMTLASLLPTEHIILCNPAEILTRLNYPFVNSLIDLDRCSTKYQNIETYRPMWDKSSKKKGNIYIKLLKNMWPIVDYVWYYAIRIIGSEKMASIYHYFIARHVNEPNADELTKVVFRKKMPDLRKTIVECILKPSLFEKIRIFDKKVHILQGIDDIIYTPYVKSLFYNNKNVILHRTHGDHHMIYHHPIMIANKLSNIIPQGCI